MSFRELRTFTETMRLLGYHRTVSMESFKTPNVELVADLCYWLVKRYDPSSDVVYEIEREADRVLFFRRICETVLTKGRIKLNIKKLYQADEYAVQEMLKIASVLKSAFKARADDDTDYSTLQGQAAQKGHQDSKMVRQLCTDLTNDGSSLFFLLEREITSRAGRNRVLSRATEIGEFERRLRELLSNVTTQVASFQQGHQNFTADATNLEQKIESKKAQLDRSQKRLVSLQKVRPAFMEEYERFEGDLHGQFVIYLEQYRNLEFLEHELAKFNRKEDELLNEQETKLKVMREKLRKEELKVLRGETFTEDTALQGPALDDSTEAAAHASLKAAVMNRERVDTSRGEIKRPRAASGRTRPQGADASTNGKSSNLKPTSTKQQDSHVGHGNMCAPKDDEESDDDEDSGDDDDNDDAEEGSLSINNDDEDDDEDSDDDDNDSEEDSDDGDES